MPRKRSLKRLIDNVMEFKRAVNEQERKEFLKTFSDTQKRQL